MTRPFATAVLVISIQLLPLSFLDVAFAGEKEEDIVVVDAFIADQARRERGQEHRAGRQVMSADLTHDGIREIVALYTIESQNGTNNHVQYLAVFTRRAGKLVPLTHTEVGAKSVRSVEMRSVVENVIHLETTGYGPKDPSCCPTIRGSTRYILAGKVLREQKLVRRTK